MVLDLTTFFDFIHPDTGFHMWFTLCVIGGAIIAYAFDKIPLEITSLAVLSILLIVFQIAPLRDAEGTWLLTPTQLLQGFANPALLTVLALLIIGQAIVRTGSLNDVANLILRVSGNSPKIAISMSLIIVMVISAILNNTPVVVIFIPIIVAMAKRLEISVSAVMIPLSYMAILGGMTTLIGSSTNLLVSGTLAKLGLEQLHFFDFFIPGSVLALVGVVYSLIVVPRILPDRATQANELMGKGDDRKFIAQVDIDHISPLCGKPISGDNFADVKDVTVKMVQRQEHAFLAPFDEQLLLEAGDIVIISATRAALSELLRSQPNTMLHKFPEMTEGDPLEGEARPVEDIGLAEVIIAPASRMIGRNLEEIGFRYNHHCIVMGIQRGTRMIRSRLTEVRLAAGDVLLVLGTQEDILTLRETRDLILLEWSTEILPSPTYARLANAILLSVVGLAALEIVPIHVTAFAGATAIILTGCLNLRQAFRALDQQIIMMVAASLAMSSALQSTGGAAFIANSLITATHGASAVVVMSALFLLMALCTNILSNNASALLFTPIAVNTATMLGADPMMFITAVILACNCSFATPVGYQTNLLVLGPGHYKFSDFIRAGVPLVFLLWATYTTYAYLLY